MCSGGGKHHQNVIIYKLNSVTINVSNIKLNQISHLFTQGYLSASLIAYYSLNFSFFLTNIHFDNKTLSTIQIKSIFMKGMPYNSCIGSQLTIELVSRLITLLSRCAHRQNHIYGISSHVFLFFPMGVFDFFWPKWPLPNDPPKCATTPHNYPHSPVTLPFYSLMLDYFHLALVARASVTIGAIYNT